MLISGDVPSTGLQRAFDSLQNCYVAQKNVRACEECGQCVGGSARPLDSSARWAGKALSEIQIVSPSERRARTDEPAATLSPIWAVNVHSGPKMTSTREPNLM